MTASGTAAGVFAPRLRTVLCVLLAAKALLFALDPTLRLFLVDSESYFRAAVDGSIPLDRSFVYPWLVRATALAGADARWLVLAQSLLGVFVAAALHAWLVKSGVRAWIALLFAALLALEPAQLFYERMLMAETAGLAGLIGMFLAASAYLARGHAGWIPLYLLLGLSAVALRFALLPVVLVLGLLPPLLWWASRSPRGGVALIRLAAHGALALLLTCGLHAAYRQTYGTLSHGPAAHHGATGRFRLAVLAPLVEPEHFEGSGVSAGVLSELRLDRRDPRLREAQLWMPGGLVDVVSRHAADPEQAASAISRRTLLDRGWALPSMIPSMLRDHLDAEFSANELAIELGRRRASTRLAAELQARIALDVSQAQRLDRPVARWYAWAAPGQVATLLLLLPLALGALWTMRAAPARARVALLALASIGLVLGHLCFSPLAAYRYLHPLPWFALASLAVIAEAVIAKAGLRRRAAR